MSDYNLGLESLPTYLRNILEQWPPTEVRITQNKGKESENSYWKLKSSRWTGTRTHTRKQNRNILTNTAVLLNQKRANVYEHTTWELYLLQLYYRLFYYMSASLIVLLIPVYIPIYFCSVFFKLVNFCFHVITFLFLEGSAA